MILLIFAAVSVVSIALAIAMHPFKRERWLDGFALGVVSLFFFGVVAAVDFAGYAFAAKLVACILGVGAPIVAINIVLRQRHLASIVRGITNPHFRDGSMRALSTYLAKLGPNARAQYARRAAGSLHERGFDEEAAAVLAALPIGLLYGNERALAANDLCAYRLRLGDVAGARSALATASSAPKLYQDMLCCKEAVILALEGQADDALALATKLDGKRVHALHRANLALARAHAHAGRGAADEARAALTELARLAPKDWIVRASKPSGPATHLAAAIHAERVQPYR
jgi:hypothetical protein